MGNSFCFAWEIPFIQLVQSAECSLTNASAVFMTMLGEEYLVILIAGLCYWCIDKRLGRNVSLALTGAIISGSLIQWIVQRRRPYMDHTEVKCIRAPFPEENTMSVAAQGYSCPSLHSAHSAGFYGALAMNVRKTVTTVIAFVMPLLIGFSRLYLGVHYPTDILFGWLLGTVVMLVSYAIEKKYGYKVGFIIQLAIGALGFFYCRDNEFFSIYGVLAGLFFGFWYEEKRVNFEKCTHWRSYILRPVFGLIIFAAVSVVLKLPVRNLPEDRYVAFQFIYRCFRYALSTFAIVGLYPYLFKRVKFLR